MQIVKTLQRFKVLNDFTNESNQIQTITGLLNIKEGTNK